MAQLAPILTIHPEHPQPRHVERAAALLESGGVMGYPTDVNYAVGCDLLSRKAIDRLYALTQRDRKKPLALVCPDLSDVAKYAHVSNFVYRTLRHLTPGPFTFVLEATRLVPQLLSTKQKQVGIRVPEAPFLVAVARALGRPLVTTTAQGEGGALVDPKDVKEQLGHGLDLIIDGGIAQGELSTVVSLLEDQLEVLRQGAGVVEGAE